MRHLMIQSFEYSYDDHPLDMRDSMHLIDTGLLLYLTRHSVSRIVFYLVLYHYWPSDWTDMIRQRMIEGYRAPFHACEPICLQETSCPDKPYNLPPTLAERHLDITEMRLWLNGLQIKFEFGHEHLYWQQSRVMNLLLHGRSLLYLLDQSTVRRDQAIQDVWNESGLLPVSDVQALCLDYF